MRTYYFRIRSEQLRDCNSVENYTVVAYFYCYIITKWRVSARHPSYIMAVSELRRRSDGPRTEKVKVSLAFVLPVGLLLSNTVIL